MNQKIEQEKNTERFTRTVSHYAQYRPTYPKTLIEFFLNKHVINNQSIIADIGSGTGIFAELLLTTGATVYGIEPNQAMQQCAESKLSNNANFISVNGTAEKTTMLNSSVDAISVATAFHWFDQQACKKEFKRILKPDGWVMLLWNLRLTELSPLSKDYEDILQKHCPQYKGIPSQQIAEQDLLAFFAENSVEILEFANQQQLDKDGLIGRLRSTSYALTPEQVGYAAMIEDIESSFKKHAVNNKVTFTYKTKLYLGKL